MAAQKDPTKVKKINLISGKTINDIRAVIGES
jgi:hypothetical protein